MKANLLQKNKNILRFPVIWKINNPQHHQSALLLKTQTQNPRFQTTQLLRKSQNPRFEKKQLLLWFQNSVLEANKTDGGFPTTKGNKT